MRMCFQVLQNLALKSYSNFDVIPKTYSHLRGGGIKMCVALVELFRFFNGGQTELFHVTCQKLNKVIPKKDPSYSHEKTIIDQPHSLLNH